jgi:hypothetical protein
MKKITIACMLAAALVLSACGNNASKKKDAQTKTTETSQQEQYLTEDLIIKLDSLISGFQKLGMMPHMQAMIDGKVVLTDKEKRIKPTFLMPLSKAADLVTLSQKNRALAVYAIDREVATMYGLPTDEYDQVIGKLAVETDNQAMIDGAQINVEVNSYDINSWIVSMGEEQLAKEQVHMFFELAAAAMLESLYITSLDIPRYITYFNDQTAADVSYRFVLVVDGVESLIPYHPELETVKSLLEPLKVINAINVKQLQDQLKTLATDIAAAREKLMD